MGKVGPSISDIQVNMKEALRVQAHSPYLPVKHYRPYQSTIQSLNTPELPMQQYPHRLDICVGRHSLYTMDRTLR